MITPLVIAALFGSGIALLVAEWIGRAGGSSTRRHRVRLRRAQWLTQAGLADVSLSEFGAVSAVLFILGAIAGYGLFAGIAPAVVIGAASALLPVATYRRRRTTRMAVAQEAWPRLIEEIRILVGSLGRSVPNALFEVGRRAPVEMHDAFTVAHREWLLTTDFARTTEVLKQRLADPTADAAIETLIVAHELGGTSLDQRLEALAAARRVEVHSRKDAVARQAGVRFARRFVVGVPAGMALVGLQIGSGRKAYATPTGQGAVLVGLLVIALCWWWAGRMMRLPIDDRVFGGLP